MPAWLAACLISQSGFMAACHSDQRGPSGSTKATPESNPRPPAQAAQPPVRGAVGDADLRVMLAELASAKACEQIRGTFQALPATDRPHVMNGALWIHGCRITNIGTKVTFRLEGNGWQWIDQEKKAAGGTFTVREYVRFAVAATIAGTLDVGYDPGSHVGSIWFSLQGDPDVKFTPIGKLDVDAAGVWSSVLSTGASLLANSLEDSAKSEVKKQGATAFKQQFADGLSVTIDLCTGLTRTGIGHIPRGKMGAPGVGETKQIAVEVQPGGVMIFGPQSASKGRGMTVDADVSKGTARLMLVCNDQAETLAKAFLDGRQSAPGSRPRVTRRAR